MSLRDIVCSFGFGDFFSLSPFRSHSRPFFLFLSLSTFQANGSIKIKRTIDDEIGCIDSIPFVYSCKMIALSGILIGLTPLGHKYSFAPSLGLTSIGGMAGWEKDKQRARERE